MQTVTDQFRIPIVNANRIGAEPDPVELPAGSMLDVSTQDGVKVYRIPEKGIWKGSRGLMFFAGIWNSSLAMYTAKTLSGNGKADDDLWILILVLALFWTVGIGLAVAAFYLGRQSALIGVREGLLFI